MFTERQRWPGSGITRRRLCANDWSGDFLMADLWLRRDERWQVAARRAGWLKPA